MKSVRKTVPITTITNEDKQTFTENITEVKTSYQTNILGFNLQQLKVV